MSRPLAQQAVVITGASSGIGRETALELGRRGASVTLAARNETALNEVAKEVERLGGKALVVPTDVSDWKQVERLASTCAKSFGQIDTWVNNAAVSAYATVEQLTVEEIERIVRVNLMGQIHGMKAALAHMKPREQGTIINVASALAERSVPLQSAYCATKHGIKGFTEALRLELAAEGSHVQVVLILPSSINTPLFNLARSKIGVKPMPIPPVYEPRVVAEAILFAAENPTRDIVVGGAGKLMTLMERISPRLLDWYMVRGDRMVKQQKTDEPATGVDNLFVPSSGAGSSTGDFGKNSKSTSVYTRILEQHPQRKRVLLAGAALGALALLRGSRR